MKMKILSIVEVHKLLQSCQVLLFCDGELLSAKVKLSVTQSTINLLDSVGSVLCEITFTGIKFKPSLISGLMIDGNTITFRVQIEPEINLSLSENGGIKYMPDILKDHDINVYCACCCNVICKNINFRRVLPLPSVEDWSYDDFFCHKHNHNKDDCDDTHTIKSKLKVVSKNDFLFDDNYSFKISTDYIANCKSFGIIHCDKCLSWLGKKTENYIKLWNCTVMFNTLNIVFSTSLNDFNNTILCKLSNSISPVFKIVITSCITDESVHFLLLRILNKNLTVLTNCQQNDNDNKEGTTVQLCERKVMKVSYNYIEEKSEIVQTWLNDPFIETIEVSKQMLLAGCNSLIKSTLMIAKPYRCIDNMNIGYLGLV